MNAVPDAIRILAAVDDHRCSEKARPDITLMDSQTPEMNGLGAMVVIRTEFPDVILTTYASEVEGAYEA